MRDGFGTFVEKEFLEIVRTWRIWVLPGMALFFAVTGPPMAKWTPQILQAVAGMPAEAAIKLLGHAPNVFDSYAQWLKNLSQVIFFALVIIYGGLVSSERNSGTAVLVLTKPISRASFVLAKVFVHGVFLAAVLVGGTLVTWGMTALVFGVAPAGPLWQASLSWLVLAWFFLAVMSALSVFIDSQAGAAGVGIGVWAALALAALSPTMVLFSPAGLIVSPSAVAQGAPFPSVWPVITSIAASVALAGAAAWGFGTKEL